MIGSDAISMHPISEFRSEYCRRFKKGILGELFE
jgi:hypothetical protein